MTDLTEQWKKGELPEGHYYVKDGENMIAEYLDGYFYNNGNPMTSFNGGVDEVIAPVPSYEEWMEKTKSLKVLAEAYCKEKQQEVIKTEYCLFDDNTPNWQVLAPVPSYDEWQEKLEQNAQYKELLKEVYVAINEGSYFDQCDILEKIDEVLK